MTALPSRRLEAWRYTDLRPLEAISFAEPPAVAAPAGLPDLGVPRLVFLNGRFDAASSTPPAYVSGFLRVVEASDHPLAMINAERAQDGITLAIPAGVDAGALLLLSHAQAREPVAFHPRHRITLGAGSRLTLIEIATGQGTYWHNAVSDIALHEQSVLHHYRLQDEAPEAFHIATIRAKIAQAASYEGFSLITGAKLSRAEYRPTLIGRQAAVRLHAAQLLRDEQQGDFTSVVAHDAPECTSRQLVKTVLSGRARGVFQGRIEVARAAQKTDGHQMNRALLLSEGAEMDVKPELEIFADDVKCGHGATLGALDPEQIFYLRSRGVPEADARALLIRAFLDETLVAVTAAPARDILEAAIDNWWRAG